MFRTFEISGNQLIWKETGIAIPITPDFAKEVVRVASFVGLIQGVRASRVLRGREPRAKISFFPRKPRSYYAIWPVCQLADIKIVDNHDDADMHFYFEDVEFLTAPRRPPSNKPALNIGCYDIRKSVVARVFEETFGYGLSVDPKSFDGLCVEKSEGNGRHDGRIVQCPMEQPRSDRVYQRLVDNTFNGIEYIDIRTPIVGGRIPFVYLKRRNKDLRFSNDNHRVDLIDADAMLSQTEQQNILKFAAAMQLDFGGLDVLRDRSTGRIYIVDANKTDMGPPAALTGKQKLKAMKGLADAFSAYVDDVLPIAS